MTVPTRAQRRQVAIKRRQVRQLEEAHKLALLPASEKRRKIRRYKRRGTLSHVIKQAVLFEVFPEHDQSD